MATTEATTARLYNVRIIGKARSYRRTMIAGSQMEAERRLRELARHLYHGGNGGHRRIEAVEVHGPLPEVTA